MTKERLSNTDMLGVADCQLCRNHLPEKMRIEGAFELTSRCCADAGADPLRTKRPAAIADPEGISGCWRCRALRQYWPMMLEILFDAASQSLRQRHLERSLVLGLVRTESNPPLVTATLNACTGRQAGDIARSQMTRGEDANHQPVTKQQSSATCREPAGFPRPLHELETDIVHRVGR